MKNDIPVRHIEEKCNVPMFKTNIPCTPAGCMYLLEKELSSLEGANAVVLGRSNIVGMPLHEVLAVLLAWGVVAPACSGS